MKRAFNRVGQGFVSNARGTIVASVALVALFGTALQGAAPASAAPPPAMQTLHGELTPVPLGDTLIGPANPSSTISLKVALQPRDPAALAAAVKAVSTPGSAQYQQFITPAIFAQQYGPTPATIAAVTSALEAEGLTVGAISSTDLYLPVSGTVAQTESAFATPLESYKLASGGLGYYNTAAPSVPSSVAPQIQDVLGLNTLNVAKPVGPLTPHVRSANGASHDVSVKPAISQPAPVAGSCTTSIDGVESNGAWDADQLAQAYSFGPLYTNGDYGAGTTVGLVELEGAGYSPSDISTFAACYGITLGGSQVSEFTSGGNSEATGGNTAEAELDIDTVLSLAPQANIDVYESDTIYDAFGAIESADVAKIVSVSWASCEAEDGSAFEGTENTLLNEMSMDGQTVFTSSGDDGSEGCDANGINGSIAGEADAVAQAINTSNGTIYVANEGNATVSVINEDNDTYPVVGTIDTATDPSSVVYDAANSKLYISNFGSNSITVVSTTSCNATVVTGCSSTSTLTSTTLNEPSSMALDGATLYIANQNVAAMAVLNTTSSAFSTAKTLPSGALTTAVVVTSSHEVYSTDFENDAVDYFNGSTCNSSTTSGCSTTASAVTGLNSPEAMTLDSNNGDVYVAGGSGGIGVVSTSSNTLVTTISTSASPMFYNSGAVDSIGMSPSGNQVLAMVESGAGDVMATIVPGTQSVSGTVGFNSGSDAMGQLVSDPTTNLTWVTDVTEGYDLVENLNLAVNDPASQPDVTGVGGTSLNSLGPAPSETVWNDNTKTGSGATGGGISQTFDMPTYQQALGQVTGSSGTPCADSGGDCREVPDVSADADPYTGYVIYDSVNGYDWAGFGGTSAASPLWAAALADISTADGTTATGFGELNPAIYTLAAASPGTYFNDVTTGNNDFNGTDGGKFPAMTGYDMATGLGTPIVSALATGLKPATATVPGAPTLTSATPSSGQVVLDWTAPSSNGGSAITGYNILRGTTSGGESATPYATVGNVLTYTDTAATNGTTYYYEIEAVNTVGHSVASNEKSALPATVPGAPTLTSATPSSGQVVLDWTAPSSNGGSAITGYNILRGTTSGGESATPYATVGNVLTYTDTAATNGTTYYYEIEAVNTVGHSVASNEKSALPATVPGAPTLTSATPSSGQVVLDWTAPSSNGGSAITGYNILRGTTSGGESATPYATVGNVLTYTDTAATNGTTYYYEIEAVNTVGHSVASNEKSALPATVPGAPTLTSATPSSGQVVLDWTAPSSNGGSAITGYNILRGTTSGGESATPYATVGNVLTYTDTAATNGTTYYYEIEAVNTVGHSVASNEKSALPQATIFTVTFNNNGGTGTMAQESASAPTALTLNTFTRTGYTFTGWNTVAGGGGTAYADGATYPFAASTTLYAQWTVNPTITITFNSEGGSAVSSMSGPEGTTITLPAAPTLAGSTFDGWFLAASGGSALTSPYTLSTSLTLYAQWTVNGTVTITFNSEGGSAVSSMSGPSGTTITLPAAPTYAGHTFNGWFLAASGGSALTSPYTLSTSLTLYAQWTTNPTITITFNSEGGSAVSSMSGPEGTTITLPAAPTLAGSTFDGWFLAASGGSALTSPYTLSTSLTLYAQWTVNGTVTITFNSEGGSAVSSMSGPSGTTITLPAAPTYAGHTFNGWFLAASGGSALTSPYTLSTSLTLYAQWTTNPTITITFNSEGGSAVSSMSGPEGTTITLPAAPTLAGSTFDGWFLAASGGSALTSPYTLTTSLTLYAQWTVNPTITITFNSEGGSAVSSMSGPEGTTITLPAAPTLAGSTFDGWFLAASGGSALTSPYTLSTSLTLYAQWTPVFTVTFNNNGGAGTMAPETDGAPTALTLNTFTRSGYTFTGWNTVAGGSGTAYADGATYPFTASVTLYAQWSLTVTITFNAEGGSAVGSISGGQGSMITLPAAPTLAGSTFNGWFLAASGGSALTSPYTLTTSLTLYAQWTVNPTVTITFNSEGGSTVGSQSGPAGTTITLPAAPSYAGYNFDGWFLAASGGSALASPYTLTSSLTLYAQWSAIIVVPPTPTVSIANLPSAATYGGQFTPSYMTSGNGTVFSVTSSTTSVCTVSGSVVNFVGVGQCTLNAHVADTTSFSGGTGAAQSFMVGPATATVSITNLPTSAQKGGQFTPSFTTSGDGTAFSVTSTSSSVCTVSGSTVSFVGAGTCDLTAAVAATTDYLAATSAESFTVKAPPKKADTRTTIVLTRSTVAYGAERSVTIVVHVTGSASAHHLSGTVRVMVGARLLCVVAINVHGNGQCTLGARTLRRGTYSVVAKYDGNDFYNASTSGPARLRII